ncbi:BglII/BstYI family type II restriction endonuclease [Phenylobacterium sp.]|uniref:BglII/BstYI family type II restriction endonuclease n=1 Tax=Phenylobacterium sp. TaxID=1871053 RepID=UPI0025DE84B9|nr:BglII/BstYI family type II restriction endonuclease [Phenylobacterium sp.]MCA3723693.1 restriction endonuclease [Phenylobacterium sp.]MCA6261838.1 restriction endonuclease [Phenylobacterium sp.]
MKIAAYYSHLNGLEYLEARKPDLLDEVYGAIASVDAEGCRTKNSMEKTKAGKVVYSPNQMNKAIERYLKGCPEPWQSVRSYYWVCKDAATNRRLIDLPLEEQYSTIIDAGFEPIQSYNQTDFVKEKVAVEVQFGKYSFVAFDLFVKHLTFYAAGRIDVGIEIIPMARLLAEMSSGPAYYERELNHLMRGGRGAPGVPLVLIGVEP